VRDDKEPSDAALWLEATSGTESAFAALFDRHRRRVFRKAYAQVRSVADAEDVVAMVFLEAWRSRANVRIVDGSMLPWLLKVTGYVISNQTRTARRYKRLLAALPEPAQVTDHADDVLGRLEREPQMLAVRNAMAKLSGQEREILDLCVVEEMSVATAAALLGLPVGTVKSKLHRAREKLRRRIPPSLSPALRARLDGAEA